MQNYITLINLRKKINNNFCQIILFIYLFIYLGSHLEDTLHTCTDVFCVYATPTSAHSLRVHPLWTLCGPSWTLALWQTYNFGFILFLCVHYYSFLPSLIRITSPVEDAVALHF